MYYIDGSSNCFNNATIIKKTLTKKAIAGFIFMAGVERIELPSTVLETGMLPLYHTPSTMKFYHSDF